MRRCWMFRQGALGTRAPRPPMVVASMIGRSSVRAMMIIASTIDGSRVRPGVFITTIDGSRVRRATLVAAISGIIIRRTMPFAAISGSIIRRIMPIAALIARRLVWRRRTLMRRWRSMLRRSRRGTAQTNRMIPWRPTVRPISAHDFTRRGAPVWWRSRGRPVLYHTMRPLIPFTEPRPVVVVPAPIRIDRKCHDRNGERRRIRVERNVSTFIFIRDVG